VFGEYFNLGVEHILTGWDHLAFLLCLLVIAGTPRRILWTVTGFTAGHAVTISCSALGLASLPRAPVEAAIALSIMIVAGEIWRNDRSTLSWRFPLVVSSGFGLLHGFGFASALADIGLPQTEVPLALLAFNLGIEAGQLAFVLACGLVWLIVRRLPQRRLPSRAVAGATLALFTGSIAGFWFVDRTLGIVGGI
jgi:hydrogenase/urease accessory protein HupE